MGHEQIGPCHEPPKYSDAYRDRSKGHHRCLPGLGVRGLSVNMIFSTSNFRLAVQRADLFQKVWNPVGCTRFVTPPAGAHETKSIDEKLDCRWMSVSVVGIGVRKGPPIK